MFETKRRLFINFVKQWSEVTHAGTGGRILLRNPTFHMDNSMYGVVPGLHLPREGLAPRGYEQECRE